MTVIEVLKRNYDKSTQGRWDFYIDARTENPKSFTVNVEGVQILRSCHATANQALNDVCFVIAAHNFMPVLLEAVDLLDELRTYFPDGLLPQVDRLLEKLK